MASAAAAAGSFIFIGNVQSSEFQEARETALVLKKKILGLSIEIVELFEIEWSDKLEEYQREHSLALASHPPDRPLLWDVNARASLGSCADVRAWAASTHGVRVLVNDAATCADLAEERYRGMLAARQHDFMFIDFDIPRAGVRRIVIDIFTSVCPITCANFRSLCVGDKGVGAQTGAKLSYVGSPVHRVMHGGFFQAGDIVAGRGDQGESIYGGAFADETFDVRHSMRGIVGMAAGRAHANASQFYVTMRALPHLDTRCVAFGRVISGLGTLSLIDMAETKNQRPVQDIRIVASGVEHSASA